MTNLKAEEPLRKWYLLGFVDLRDQPLLFPHFKGVLSLPVGFSNIDNDLRKCVKGFDPKAIYFLSGDNS